MVPLDKCYINLSGHINEVSVLHKFHYYFSSVTRKGFYADMIRVAGVV